MVYIKWFRAIILFTALLRLAGAYIAWHGLSAAIAANDNPQENWDGIESGVLWFLGYMFIFLLTFKPVSKLLPPASPNTPSPAGTHQ